MDTAAMRQRQEARLAKMKTDLNLTQVQADSLKAITMEFGQKRRDLFMDPANQNMSREDRTEFLKNAQRWSKMTAPERQAWRDLVAHVPLWPPLPATEIMPPLPPGIMPPSLPSSPPNISLPPTPPNMRVVATNHS